MNPSSANQSAVNPSTVTPTGLNTLFVSVYFELISLQLSCSHMAINADSDKSSGDSTAPRPSSSSLSDTVPTASRGLAVAVLAEFLGTAFLLMAIVGSGIMAQSLTDDVGIQLTINIVSTAASLGCLIIAFISISGAHFNPAVSLVDVLLGNLKPSSAVAYVVAQLGGGVVGVMLANLMFELDAINWSTRDRSGAPLLLGEAIATLGLLIIIHTVSTRHGDAATAFSVAAFIAGAFAFTSSTSFANPAVTVARTLSDTFAGIQPRSAVGFFIVQVVVAVLSVPLVKLLRPPSS